MEGNADQVFVFVSSLIIVRVFYSTFDNRFSLYNGCRISSAKSNDKFDKLYLISKIKYKDVNIEYCTGNRNRTKNLIINCVKIVENNTFPCCVGCRNRGNLQYSKSCYPHTPSLLLVLGAPTSVVLLRVQKDLLLDKVIRFFVSFNLYYLRMQMVKP